MYIYCTIDLYSRNIILLFLHNIDLFKGVIMTIYDLLQLPSLKDKLRIAAGFSGLGRKISSVTVIDTPDGFNWLKGGEVIITTAYAMNNSEDAFVKFVKDSIKKNGSALIIKLDRYWNTIPDKVLQLAEQEKFPILSSPGSLAFLDIITPVLSNIVSVQALALQESNNIHKRFTELAINENTIPEILHTLGSLIKAPVAFVDEIFGKIYFSSEYNYNHIQDSSYYINNYETFLVASKKQQYGYIVDLTEHSKKQEKDIWELNIYQTAIEYASIVIIVRMQMLLSNKLIEDKYKTSFIEDLFLNNVKTLTEIQSKAQLYGWNFIDGGLAVIIDINNIKKKYITNLDKETNSKLQNYIDCIFRTSIQYMKQYFPNTKYYSQSDVISFLIFDEYKTETKEKLKHVFEDIQSYLAPLVPFTVTMAVGSYVDQLINIHQSYEQAKKVIQISYQMEKFNCIIFFDEIGVYHLLFSIADQKESFDFCLKYIKPLKDYDQRYHTDLLETLYMIVECGWNIKDASQKLFIHYNSAKYRFRKICEILNIDLKETVLHTEVELAVKLYQLHQTSMF